MLLFGSADAQKSSSTVVIGGVGLHQRLLECQIKALFLRKPVFEVGVDRLKHREVCSLVVPRSPSHQVFDPFRVYRAKLALDLPDHLAVPTSCQVDSFAEALRGLIQ
jgi:hypothetical protein